ncbi:MAG: phosphate ABC transporter permease subunit PstC [Alphaproteobacteria bacterium]|nr:phosphate ABC transporter permease subunit PstC [Alphaproteobacteria bacterium]
MAPLFVLVVLLLVGLALVLAGRARAVALVGGDTTALASRPAYHGAFLLLAALVPAASVLIVWAMAGPVLTGWLVVASLGEALAPLDAAERGVLLASASEFAAGRGFGTPSPLVENAAMAYRSMGSAVHWLFGFLATSGAVAGALWGWRKIAPRWPARPYVERAIITLLGAAAGLAILTTLAIIFSLVLESIRFFQLVSPIDFLFGLHWSPQSAYAGVGGEAGTRTGEVFGALPVLAGTLLITAIAIAIAAPVGLLSAIYLSEYASDPARAILKPVLEILAGIPTIVYGFFAALSVAPFVRQMGEAVGLSVSSQSALAAGLVMGVMIIPFVSSLSDDIIRAVPQTLRDASAALGATRSETIVKTVLPAAMPGVVSALLLAISRAIGETMIVVMAAGLAANLTLNPFEAVTTVTVQIVTLLVGDQAFDSAKTLSAFALGLMLFTITLMFNILALKIVTKYRQNYD